VFVALVVSRAAHSDRDSFLLPQNTASRMESNGKPGRIHLSQETADCLAAAGKPNWVTQREDKITAKGKGELTTYWLSVATNQKGKIDNGSSHDESSRGSTSAYDDEDDLGPVSYHLLDPKTERLVRWHVELLFNFITKLAAQSTDAEEADRVASSELAAADKRTNPLDEVVDVLCLPENDLSRDSTSEVGSRITGMDAVNLKEQLADFVSTVATMYQSNPFHNFEHASHVTMSCAKLLSRIITPADIEADDMHAYTYGIASDAMTQFACVFGALVHDVDHPGIPNSQLVVEDPKLAEYYKGKSIAEQNSLDLAWNLLQDDRFCILRSSIYRTDAQRKRFRQLLVNIVMATDVMDKDLKEQRNERWDKAFLGDPNESTKELSDRRATIVIEHLIQASDVSHTMQVRAVCEKWVCIG